MDIRNTLSSPVSRNVLVNAWHKRVLRVVGKKSMEVINKVAMISQCTVFSLFCLLRTGGYHGQGNRSEPGRGLVGGGV